MGENSGRVVLCGANAYEQKYYFNEKFSRIPESIKEELHIICVLFTEEAGGVFTIVFEEDGSVSLETDAYEEDILYDEISSGLLPYKVTRAVMENAGAQSVFLHCLPAFHDLKTKIGKEQGEKYGFTELEVTDEVFESERSLVFDEAENRMHTIKAVIAATLGA